MSEPIFPYLECVPGEPILAQSFNDMQANIRQHVETHDHTGGASGPKLGGDAIDEQAHLKVQDLTVTGNLNATVTKETQRYTGDLTIEGRLGIGTTLPDRELSVNGILKISRPGDEDRWTTDSWSKGIELDNGHCIQFLQGGTGDSVGIGGNLGTMYFTRSSADDASAAQTVDMVIDPKGNVGIGTTDPDRRLTVEGELSVTAGPTRDNIEELLIHAEADLVTISAARKSSFANTDLRLGTQNTGGGLEVMRLTSDGNVGIGTAEPTARLTVVDGDEDASMAAVFLVRDAQNHPLGSDASARFEIHTQGDPKGGALLTIGGSLSQNACFLSAWRLIDGHGYGSNLVLQPQSGNVGIGTSPEAKLHVKGDVLADNHPVPSSRRWKQNISSIEGALEKVQHLRGVSFDWIDGGKHDIGLIGEEVAEVVPEAVGYEENGREVSSVEYLRLVPVLIEAIKEQQRQLDELRVTVTT